MPNVALFKQDGSQIGEITLNEEIFGIEPNESVVFDAVIMQRASLRQGTHAVRNRSAVRGGGRKPWRQKGTGRARQGSTRAVQWVGGGIAHGVSPRDYSFKINRKERVLALKSALADKLANKKVVIFENLEMPTLKTKDFKELIKKANLEGKILFVTADDCENLFMACRNLGYAYHILADEINVLDIVNADTLVLDEAAVKIIEEGIAHA